MPALLSAITVAAAADGGVDGIVRPLMTTWPGRQALADLVIVLVLVLAWLVRDPRRRGRNPWPWVVATLLVGSFGPLAYLLTRRGPDDAR